VVPFGPTSADEPTLTAEQLLEFAPDSDRVELVMEPGEAVLLHNMLLHKVRKRYLFSVLVYG
jgi:hypothetical protein